MKKIFFAALVLMALTACKNVKETAEIIDLPRTETPDSVARAMDGFFEQAATDSMDIHSVMIVLPPPPWGSPSPTGNWH